MSRNHDRFEVIAGAIALGEATDEQRREYREHLAACRNCLHGLGGEHEIERTAQMVVAARESETWQPQLHDVVSSRMQRRARKWQYGFGVASMCVALSLGAHALFAANVTPLTMAQTRVAAVDNDATHVVLEQRAPSSSYSYAAAPRVAPAPQRQMVVMHNVITMQRAPVAAPQAPPVVASEPKQIASVTVHPQTPVTSSGARSNRPVWDRVQNSQAWRTVATTTTTSELETAPQTLTHSAESMQFGPVRHDRDAMLAGGETSLNPQPPMIAYDEGAQGTSAFEVLVDERGNPTKCVITKSSGFVVLDNTVCKAAMAARYLPKIQAGRAVAGVYRDAFTFRMQDNNDIEGIPQTAPHAGTPQPANAQPSNPHGN